MKFLDAIDISKEALLETIWPTRCCICDEPGVLLCSKCKNELQVIDQLKSCKKCGEPFGRIQCCNCSTKKLNPINAKLYFSNCVSFCILDHYSGRIVILCKDAGERRLSNVIAYFISCCIPKSWIERTNTYITYIPSSKEAILKRGFDHCLSLATCVSKILNIKLVQAFKNPSAKDQRKLNRKERIENLENNIEINKHELGAISPESTFIIIDDVFTTGSTLNSASKSLKDTGASNIYCATFARAF